VWLSFLFGQPPEKSTNYKENASMKKATKITLGVVGGLILISTIASSAVPSNIDTNTNQSPTSNADTSQQQPAQPAPEKMTIKNSTYNNKSYYSEVVGEITNNDTEKRSVTLKATFYDANSKILGTATGALNDIAPGETKTFSLMTTDEVSGYKDMKVQVDTIF
jgi:flagellar basal body-associated protein FliL